MDVAEVARAISPSTLRQKVLQLSPDQLVRVSLFRQYENVPLIADVIGEYTDVGSAYIGFLFEKNNGIDNIVYDEEERDYYGKEKPFAAFSHYFNGHYPPDSPGTDYDYGIVGISSGEQAELGAFFVENLEQICLDRKGDRQELKDLPLGTEAVFTLENGDMLSGYLWFASPDHYNRNFIKNVTPRIAFLSGNDMFFCPFAPGWEYGPRNIPYYNDPRFSELISLFTVNPVDFTVAGLPIKQYHVTGIFETDFSRESHMEIGILNTSDDYK